VSGFSRTSRHRSQPACQDDGELQRHVARVRRVYANRREILATSLRRTFGEGIEFTLAAGGMALWAGF
jgi:DNA-binding transcriptional MocR family regulator